MQNVTIYTDGSARGNPDGPGGYGAILRYVDREGKVHEKELSQGYEKTTNNRMEMMGVIAALEELHYPCRVDIYTDSQYVVNAFEKGWIQNWIKNNWKTASKGPVKNKELWERMLKAAKIHVLTFHWIKGHAGHPENERCDKLATAAADSMRNGM